MLIRWLLMLLFTAVTGLAWGQQVPVPRLDRPVTDLTGTLQPAQIDALAARLLAFEQRKGSQVAVLIVPSTQPETIEQYAIRVAEAWKLGRKRVDDGAILVVARNDRALRIEVGYGLEGVLTDAASKRIIEERIVPRFRAGDYAGGIETGVDSILSVIDGEPLPPPARARGAGWQDIGAQDRGWQNLLPVAFVAVMVLGAVLRALLGRVMGAALTGGIIGGGAWLLAGTMGAALAAGLVAFLLTVAVSGRRGLGAMMLEQGLRGGRGRGGWGGGGGMGGGWSGGGGGFGGGGASGRW